MSFTVLSGAILVLISKYRLCISPFYEAWIMLKIVLQFLSYVVSMTSGDFPIPELRMNTNHVSHFENKL